MKYMLIGLIAVVAAYIYVYLAYVKKYCRAALRIGFWIPLAVLAAATAWCTRNFNFRLIYFLTGMMSILFLPLSVFAFISLIGKCSGLVWKKTVRPVTYTGLAIACIISAGSAYALIFGWRHVVTKETTIYSDRLPEAFDGYRIVQLSDLHLGTYRSSPRTVRKIVEKANEAKGDVILFTGDIVNFSHEEIDPFFDELKKLKAKDGVYSVLGNHDYCIYANQGIRWADASKTKVIEKEKAMGWHLLLNEHRYIRRDSSKIALVGVTNYGKPGYPRDGDLDKAEAGIPSGTFKILMSHDPTHWRSKVLPNSDVDLTLSGHTHAMQLKFGNFSPSKWSYPEWGGLYERQGQALYVSTGSGSNIAFRWGAWPEIDIITIRRR